MPNYDIVLFDADETLFDYVRAAKAALNTTLIRYGLPCPADVWERYQRWNHEVWEKFERGEMEKSRLQTERFRLLFGELSVSADLEEFNRDYKEKLSEGGYALPGAEELCRALAPFCRLYIVTNGFTYTQERRMERSPLKQYIRKMYISEQVGFQKPRKEYFDAVLNDIGVSKGNRVILLGDSLTSDMQGGINAGITTCWYHPEGEEKTQLPIDYEIQRLEQFVPIVLGSEREAL